MTYAVVVWNTVQMAKVIEDLKAEGVSVAVEDIVHLSPARYGHINPYGKYSFEIGELPEEGQVDLEQQSLPRFAWRPKFLRRYANP